MMAKLKIFRQMYRDESRFDWVVLVADVLGFAIVLLAFVHARIANSTPELTMQIASIQF